MKAVYRYPPALFPKQDQQTLRIQNHFKELNKTEKTRDRELKNRELGIHPAQVSSLERSKIPLERNEKDLFKEESVSSEDKIPAASFFQYTASSTDQNSRKLSRT